jgi:hypothetical protein
MSYVRASEVEAITPESIQLLAQILGLPLPAEDVAPLAAAVAGQLASISTLDRLDLTDIHPSLHFDPRWHG